MKTLKGRRGTRAASFAAVFAVVAGGCAGNAAVSSAAATRKPTQTVLNGSSISVSPGGSVTITATIHPGLLSATVGGLSYGSVSFIDTTDETPLGSEPVSGCVPAASPTPCVVSIVVPATSLISGENTITGTYSGDRLQSPSTGTLLVSEGQSGGGTTTCSTSCNTGTVFSDDGTTSLEISAPAGSDGSITDSFSTTPLACSTPGVGTTLGDTIVFSATGLTGNKTIDYDVYGSAADALDALYGGGEHLCYDSPEEFTTLGGSPAAPDGSGGFDGLLPQCKLRLGGHGNGTAPNPPCVDYAKFTTGEVDTYVEQFETTASDPRATN